MKHNHSNYTTCRGYGIHTSLFVAKYRCTGDEEEDDETRVVTRDAKKVGEMERNSQKKSNVKNYIIDTYIWEATTAMSRMGGRRNGKKEKKRNVLR